jgi:hypothetical protein
MLKGHADLIFREVGWRSHSDSLYYVFRPDLTLPIETSQANRPFQLRELRPEDIPQLLALDAGSESEDVLEVIIRLLMLKAGLATCFTIVTNDDIPWYLGWLIDSSQNEKIQKIFKGGIPALAPDEVLLEGGYTAERHRRPGLRIWKWVKIIEKSMERGAKWAMASLRVSNTPGHQSCEKNGFVPFFPSLACYLNRLKNLTLWKIFDK